MKKILFLFSLLFLSDLAIAQMPQCDAPENYVITDPAYQWWGNVNIGQTGFVDAVTTACANQNGFLKRGPHKGSNIYDYFCLKKKQPCDCPAGQIMNTSLQAGGWVTECIDEPEETAPPEENCPSGQQKDALGKCNTLCDSTGYAVPLKGNACEPPTSCEYPQKHDSISNTCNANEDKCALNASVNIISGYTCQQCAGCPEPNCPAGWTITETNQCNQNATSSSPSSSGSTSSTPSSSGSTSSVPRQQPPTDSNDNTDQSQSTSNSQSIPTGISNNDCLNSHSTTACKVIENCQLTFGTENCLGVTGDINCPNSYIVNGQKICVLNTSGSNSSSGSNTSSGGNNGNSSEAGECDPTSKNYLRCLTVREVQIPDSRGSFDETKAALALQEANEDLQNKIDAIKTEMNQVLSVGIDGSGTITDNCLTIVGQEVCFGFAKFTGLLDIIPWAIMLLAYLAALFVILRK